MNAPRSRFYSAVYASAIRVLPVSSICWRSVVLLGNLSRAAVLEKFWIPAMAQRGVVAMVAERGELWPRRRRISWPRRRREIGRASCREGGEVSGGGVGREGIRGC